MSLRQPRLLLAFLAACTVCAAPALALASSRDGRRGAHSRSRRAVHSGRRRAHRRHHRRARPHGAPPVAPSPSPSPPAGTSAPPAEPTPEAALSGAGGDPFAGRSLYVEAASPASRTESEWASEGRTAEAAAIAAIATRPQAKWFGDWSYGHGGTAGDVGWWVGLASASGQLPVLVAYDLPWRDCGQYSVGGAASPASYESFIQGMASGIAGRRAVVILEPDALSELSCLSSERQGVYYRLLSYAVRTLAGPLTTVYLDAGHAGWQPATTMAARLRLADVAGARGFSLNVSNFDATASELAYGRAIAHELPEPSHFVIDTSRNGRGSASGGAWCNPPGRALGATPTASTGDPLADAYLWIKRPGESDGTCNGGPAAGTWWPSYALELALNAGF